MERQKTIASRIIEVVIITLVVIGLTYVSVIAEPSQAEEHKSEAVKENQSVYSNSFSYLEVQANK